MTAPPIKSKSPCSHNRHTFSGVSRWIWLLLFLASYPTTAWAQLVDPMLIKNSGMYYFGEGTAANEDEARDFAQSELARSIVVDIETESVRDLSFSGDQASSRFQSRTSATSRLTAIMGLQFVTVQEANRNRPFVVLAYVSKEDFNESLETLARPAREAFRGAEDIGQFNAALGLVGYLKAAERAQASPFPVRYTSDFEGEIEDLAVAGRQKAEQILRQADLTSEEPTFMLDASNQASYTWRLRGAYQGGALSNVNVRLVEPGVQPMAIQDGVVELTSFQLHDDLDEQLEVELRPEIEADSALTAYLEASPLLVTRSISLDLRPAVSVEINQRTRPSGVMVFEGKVEGISVSRMQWTFSDGFSSTETSVSRTDLAPGELIVSLKVNGNPELTAERTVTIAGPETVSTPTDEPREEETDNATAPSETDPGELVDDGRTAGDDANTDQPRSLADQLATQSSLQQALGYLRAARDRGDLVFSTNPQAFSNPSELIVLVVDEGGNRIIGVYPPGPSPRAEVSGGPALTRDQQLEYRSEGYSTLFVLASDS